MALVDQKLDSRAVDEKSLLEWLNRQARPVLIKLRDVVNARVGGYYAETFGDGVAATYSIEHGLGSRDVLVQLYLVATGADVTEAFSAALGGSIIRTDENNLSLTNGLGAVAVDEVRVVVRL